MSLDGIQGTHFDPSQLSWKQQSESAWVKDALRKGEEEARLKAQAAAAPPPPPKPQVSFSDAAQAAFEQQLAARSAQKTAGTSETGAERYAKAKAEGVSLDEWERAEFSGIPLTDLQEKTAKFGGSGGSLTATSKNGTVVTVTSGRADLSSADIRNTLKITRPDGLQLDLELDGDVRINDSEDGSLSVYFPSSGKTCVFDASGAMTVRQDEAGQSGTNGDDILINVKGSLVDGGDGDDTIINLADDAVINGGTGDDTIFANRVKGNTIDAGEGNDRLLGGAIRDSSIDMGEGNNTIAVSSINGGSVRLGDGDNTLNVGGFGGSTHNSEDMKTILDNALDVRLGNGNNTVRVRNMTTYAGLHIGDGDNTLSMYAVDDKASMTVGNGNNTLNIDTVCLQGSVQVGDGKNIYTGSSILCDGHVTLGDGGNTVRLSGALDGHSTLSSGNGDDTFDIAYLYNGTLNTGGGRDTIYTQNICNATIHGSGKNNIHITDQPFGSPLNVEAGKNTTMLRQAMQRYALQTI